MSPKDNIMSLKEQLEQEVNRIASDIAGPNADDVDKNARFPIEAITALKDAQALSAGIPEYLGGAGMNIIEQGLLCQQLSQYCSATAMILGMHFIKISSIVHFGVGKEKFEAYLRSVVDQQRLVGSVTSEEGVGGNLRTSITSVESEGDTFSLTKQSSCMSYGAYADDMLITCRKDGEAAASNQVLVLAVGDDIEREQKGVWDSLGMRGTCSPPFTITVHAESWKIFEHDFAHIAARTMVPDTHFIWANVWLGIATNAAKRARSLVQNKARKNPSVLPENARDLAQLEIELDRFRDTVKSVGELYLNAHIKNDIEFLFSIPFSLKINALKLNSSQMAAEICIKAMQICGFAGYLNNTPFSVGRHLRDALSAAPMIGNGRIIETNATNLMVYKGK